MPKSKNQLSLVRESNPVNTPGLESSFSPSIQNKETIQQEQSENLLARPEMHMFLRPYFLLDKRADRMAEIDTKEIVMVNGKQIERRWCVKPDTEYGMPGAFDRDVLLAIYEIAYEEHISKNMPVPEVMSIGTLRAFCKRLGLTYGGKTSIEIKQSLKRLAYTTCKSENSFFDKKRSLFLCESFKLLRGVGITGDTGGDGEVIETSFVTFDEHVRNNLNARYLMVIDLKYMRTLKTDVVKHLYPLLSHWLWRSSQERSWRVEYQWLASHLGIKVWKERWRAKQQLKAANEELKNKKYISDYKWDGWNLLYFPGEVFEAEQMRRAFAKGYFVAFWNSHSKTTQGRKEVARFQ